MPKLATLEQPTAPRSALELGLDLGFLVDLALKILYFAGNATASDIARRLALRLNPTFEILDFMRKERFCEIISGDGQSSAMWRYSLSAAGAERALSALAISGYVGPTPVPLSDYLESVRRQSIHKMELSKEAIEEGLSTLVLQERTLDSIGQAISSRQSTMLYGASGNGKSTAAEGLRRALPGHIVIPYAVEVMHQVIKLYDSATHEVVGETRKPAKGWLADKRWIVIKRPAVFAAGELGTRHLELILDEAHKTYEAPIQMKANGGLLVIDDFGRQYLDAAYLLNRWIVPLERGIDNLSLADGTRFQVPFDVIPLFLTNRPPAELADEAFLRRIRYKIEMLGPDKHLFIEILKRECQRNEITYSNAAAHYLISQYYEEPGREMRGCHPRDIVEAIAAAARYKGRERALTRATIDHACANYFI